MSVGFARPDVSNLVFHLYGRTVHPELFRVHAETEYVLDRFTAVLRLCDAGHMIVFHTRGQTLTEVAADGDQPLPQRKRLLERKLRGCRDDSVRFECGLKYQVSYQLEKVDPDVFLCLHEELWHDCAKADLSHRFPAATRLAPGPVSLMRTETGPRSLLVHAFHTFPEECAIVKTQSLFEL
jgi:hypothetical protein